MVFLAKPWSMGCLDSKTKFDHVLLKPGLMWNFGYWIGCHNAEYPALYFSLSFLQLRGAGSNQHCR